MKRKLIPLILAVFLLSATPADALQVRQVDSLPYYISGISTSAVESVYEIPPVDAVAYEVYHLEQTLPSLVYKDWPVYILSQHAFLNGAQLTGCVRSDVAAAFLFSRQSYHTGIVWLIANGTAKTVPAALYLASFTVAHEIGHVVRFQCVSYWRLQEYMTLRGSPPVNPEELFAEDFRWLFGSDRVRVIDYQLGISPPGEKERQYMLRILPHGAA